MGLFSSVKKNTVEDELKREIQRLNVDLQQTEKRWLKSEKRINELKLKLKQYEEKEKQEKQEKVFSINPENVNQYITTLLNNESINISLLPDVAERKIYNDIFTIIMNIMNETLKTTKIEFIGHEITFTVKPIS
jgi:TolA-binding protein